MATLSTLLSDLNARLGDAANTIWNAPEKTLFISDSIRSLYPSFFLYSTATTVAGPGPLQAMPIGCVNLHYVGLTTPTSNRARLMRGWQEGNGSAIIPKLNITGNTLIWSWTAPHACPTDVNAVLTVTDAGVEVARLRAEVSAYENILGDRTKTATYFAQQVREGVTEAEIVQHLDALHFSIESRLKGLPPLPPRIG